MSARAPVFHANWPDNNHCLQATALMALNTLGIEATWSQINDATSYDRNLYTWAVGVAVVIAEHIPGTHFVSEWYYDQFSAQGEPYLAANWGTAWFKQQKEHASADFAKERGWADAAVNKDVFKHAKLQGSDILPLLEKSLVIAAVNEPVLYNRPGQSGHYVLLFGGDDQKIWLHDPGLPPKPSQEVPLVKFNEAFRKEVIIVPRPAFEFGPKISQGIACYCGSGNKFRDCHAKFEAPLP
jgi:hypothetical protein